jgi:hypothetical protein
MHVGYWYRDHFFPPIAGGSGEDEPPPGPPSAPRDDPGSETLRRELEAYQRLAEERGQALAARDAELAGLRQAAEQHQAAAEAVQRQLLAAHRARLLAEHHGRIVDDLVQGDTVDELNASVARAEAAYSSVAEQVRTAAAASVPAGNAARTGAGLALLSPQEKIAYGLRNGR